LKVSMWRLLDSMARSTVELASHGDKLTVDLHDVNSESPKTVFGFGAAKPPQLLKNQSVLVNLKSCL
jgi:hypothetical protein